MLSKKRELVSIAPMVDMTDNNFRFFSRKLTKHAFLYTEMINEHAIINIERTVYICIDCLFVKIFFFRICFNYKFVLIL